MLLIPRGLWRTALDCSSSNVLTFPAPGITKVHGPLLAAATRGWNGLGKASDRRLEQVKSLLIRTLSELIREELKDPRVGIFSLTEIHLSRDLSHADVLVAVVGGRTATEECVAVLSRATPLLWNRLREATDLRSVPKLRFIADNRGEYADQIFTILEQLKPEGTLADEEWMSDEEQPETDSAESETNDEKSEVRQ